MKGAETPPEPLLKAALHLLAARRRGVEELRGRLRKKGFEAGAVDNCLAWLRERDLLDDAAFSQALIRDRMNFSPRGAFLMKQELARKGISPSVAQEALDTVFQEGEVSEAELAEEAARRWTRKQGDRTLEALLASDYSQESEGARRRLFGFLARRGFRGEGANRGLTAAESEARKRMTPND